MTWKMAYSASKFLSTTRLFRDPPDSHRIQGIVSAFMPKHMESNNYVCCSGPLDWSKDVYHNCNVFALLIHIVV